MTHKQLEATITTDIAALSDFVTFKQATDKHPDVARLRANLESAKDGVLLGRIKARLTRLLGIPAQTQRLHPHDTIVAVYLRLLALHDVVCAGEIAQRIHKRTGFFWANLQAIQVLIQIEGHPLDEATFDVSRFYRNKRALQDESAA